MKSILLFDLETHGHHSSYIYYLAEYWREHSITGTLHIVVSPEFLVEHRRVAQNERVSENSKIQFTPIKRFEAESLPPRNNAILSLKRALQEWRLLNQYADQLEADHCVLLYLDRTHFPIILRRALPCPFSSIYFRPTFHYSRFISQQPSWTYQIQSWRERFQILFGSKHPMAHTLFCLDSFAVEQINNLIDKPYAVYLPDPVPVERAPNEKVAALHNHLQIDPNRSVGLLFGAIDERKGIYEILEALSSLSEDSLKKLCFLIVGKLGNTDKQVVLTRIKQLESSRPLQIILKDTFISEEEVPRYFQLSDFVLAAYKQHVGMSGILVRAAAAGKPIICSDYGLMGEITRQFKLGLLVDSKSPQEIAKAIEMYLAYPLEKLCDREKMHTFARANSTEKFAKTIFSTIDN